MRFNEYLVKAIHFLQGVFFKKDNICPYCKNKNFKTVFKKAYVIDICQCSQCGLYWTNPIFKLWRFYDFLYQESGLTTHLSKGKKLKTEMDTGFRNTDKDYSAVIYWLKKNIKGRRLLEFGSSWGYLLYQAQSQGFDVTGVDISEKRRKFGIDNLKVKILPNIDLLIANKEKYDVIVTFHTLEHLTYIGDIFSKFRALLNENGTVLIIVPFFETDEGERNFKIIGAVHPLGFNKVFFARNLPKEGFEVSFYNELVICKKIYSNVSSS